MLFSPSPTNFPGLVQIPSLPVRLSDSPNLELMFHFSIYLRQHLWVSFLGLFPVILYLSYLYMNLIGSLGCEHPGELCALIHCLISMITLRAMPIWNKFIFFPKAALHLTFGQASHHSLQVCYYHLKTSAHTIPTAWNSVYWKEIKFILQCQSLLDHIGPESTKLPQPLFISD